MKSRDRIIIRGEPASVEGNLKVKSLVLIGKALILL